MGIVKSARPGTAFTVPLNASAGPASHSGTPRRCASSSASWMRATLRLRSRTETTSPRFQEGGHVDLPAVHPEVPVTHELPGLGARGGEAEPVDDVVEPALEELEQRLAGHAARPVGEREVAAELRLEHAVDAPQLLLLAQLDRVLAEPRARLAVLARRIVAPLGGALVGVAALALQEELQPVAPAVPADGPGVSCHVDSSDPPPLGRPTAVVRDGGDVLYQVHR